MPATPRRSRSFGGSAHHQRLLLANMAASLFAAEGITTVSYTHLTLPTKLL
jgi:large subunit ribosomal protein L17